MKINTSSLPALMHDFFTGLIPLYVQRFSNLRGKVSLKQKGELVGELDVILQKKLIVFLGHLFPGHKIVAEEGYGGWPEDARDVIVIDPLDGTVAHFLGLPVYGTMVAIVMGSQLAFSAIFLPHEYLAGAGGLYCAIRGRGAWLYYSPTERLKLRVSNQTELTESCVFVEGGSKETANNEFVVPLSRTVRRYWRGFSTASSATRLASAGNRSYGLDGIVTLNNRPWDNLPATLLVEEAGGKVTDWRGNLWSLENQRNLVLSNGRVHNQILNFAKGGVNAGTMASQTVGRNVRARCY